MPKKGEDERIQMAPVPWEEALDEIADRLRQIKNENGPQSIAFMGSRNNFV